jgi:hypothetical protein
MSPIGWPWFPAGRLNRTPSLAQKRIAGDMVLADQLAHGMGSTILVVVIDKWRTDDDSIAVARDQQKNRHQFLFGADHDAAGVITRRIDECG